MTVVAPVHDWPPVPEPIEPPDPEDLTVAEVLERAADYIDEHGWCQNAGWGPNGTVCAAAAIYATTGGWTDAAFRAATAVEGATGCFVFEWNDEPGRTREQVTRLLRETAAQEAAKEAA